MPVIIVSISRRFVIRGRIPTVFGLFGPPDIKKLKAKSDIKNMIKALKYRKGSVQSDAAAALREIGAPAVVPLIAMLSNSDPKMRKKTAELLGSIRDARAVEPLIARLKDRDTIVQSQAVCALELIGDERAVDPLIHFLETTTDRRYVVQALGTLKDARALSPLMLVLANERDNFCRAAARDALQKIDPGWARSQLARSLVPSFIKRMEDIDIEVLGMIGDPSAIRPLVKFSIRKKDARYQSDLKILIYKSLEKILRESASDIEAEELQTLAILENIQSLEREFLDYGDPGSDVKIIIDSSVINALARQELARRGTISH